MATQVSDLTANVRFANDPSNPVAEYLVSPDGDTVGYGQNSAVTSTGTTPSTSLSAFVRDPAEGTWTLILAFAEPTLGTELSEPYWGQIRLGAIPVVAPQVPDSASTTLVAGQPVTVPVRVVNTGIATADFFVDPRLTSTESLALAPLVTDNPTLPLTGREPSWVVPSETSSISVTSTAAVPSMFDFEPLAGDPDIASAPLGQSGLCATTAVGSYTPAGGLVTPGVWEAGPTLCGPYASLAPNESDTIGMTAVTRTFDQTVTSSTGDAWLGAINPSATFTPLVLKPGQVGTINVTFTPTAAAGTSITGELYIDTLEGAIPPPAYGQSSGDEVAAIPYSYTVAASG